MDDVRTGNTAGGRIVYSKDLRRLVRVDDAEVTDGKDPDRYLSVKPEDMDVFADPEERVPFIVLPGEQIHTVLSTREPRRLALQCRDGGKVYNGIAKTDLSRALPATIQWAPPGQGIAVTEIGAPTDRVRVIVSPRTSPSGEAMGQSPHEILGFVRTGDGWKAATVCVIPVREELFSRAKGLLETDALADATVFVVGLGSGGSPIAWELPKQGVMHFDIMDHDRLETGNVVRHMAGISDVGRLKTDVMREMILEKNPFAEVRAWDCKVSWNNTEFLRRIIRRADVVVIATDNRESRVILNKLCVEENTPCIIAAAFRRAHGGQVLRVRPHESPCYQCFLGALPEQAAYERVSNQEQADEVAYSDRPVAVEPGLSTDIAPISLMVVKLVIQELLKGKETTLKSLDEDLSAPWYIWLNRREKDTDFENLEPLECSVDGMHVLRWYGVDLPRNTGCPCCGDYVGETAARDGVEVSGDDAAEFAEQAAAI
ncbi:MAG: ThiF family adenylyltransferase [Phycisphaerae bacterium]|nr:ThiF family adenylyltransferase [Phycisphaerae bacterium]